MALMVSRILLCGSEWSMVMSSVHQQCLSFFWNVLFLTFNLTLGHVFHNKSLIIKHKMVLLLTSNTEPSVTKVLTLQHHLVKFCVSN